MSDEESLNITSRPGAAQPTSAAPGDAIVVENRVDVLRPVPVTDVSLRVDPARPDVVIAEFWNGDHRAYGAFAEVTETAAAVTVEVVVGVLPRPKVYPAQPLRSSNASTSHSRLRWPVAIWPRVDPRPSLHG